MPDVLGFLKKAAPWVATAVSAVAPGPIGVVAGVVSKALGGAAEVKPTADSVLAAISPLMNTEDGRLKLAQIEADTQKAFNDLQVKSLDELVQLEQIEAGDRASARTMASTKDVWTPRLLAAYVCFSSTLILISVLRGWDKGIDAVAMNILSMLMGFVFKDLTQVLNFYFGTSSGSEEKTKLIANLTNSPKQ
jgi:hypothetical protein